MRKTILYLSFMAVFSGMMGCASYRTTAVVPSESGLRKDLPDIMADSSPEKMKSASETIVTTDTVLTLSAAVSRALLGNPRLAAYSYEIRAREALAVQASLLPNPELNIELENFAGSGDLSGFNGTETTVSLGQLIELAGKRAKRTRVAAFEADLAGWDYQAARLNVLMEVLMGFTEVHTAQQRVALNRELVNIAEQFLQSIRKRVEAGKVSPAEASRARVVLSATRIDLERSKRELQSARKRLAASWGSSEIDFDRVKGKLDTTVHLPSLEKLQKLAEQNPDIARWATEMQYRQASLELEKAGRIPDPTISGGYRRLNETGDNTLVMGMSVPLPLFNRNQGRVQEAKYRQRQAELRWKAVEVEVNRRLTEVYNFLSAAYTEVNTLKSSVLPEARKAFEVINQGYLMGKFGFLDVLDAQRTLFETRSRYLNALRDYHQSVAELERLTGQNISNLQ